MKTKHTSGPKELSGYSNSPAFGLKRKEKSEKEILDIIYREWKIVNRLAYIEGTLNLDAFKEAKTISGIYFNIIERDVEYHRSRKADNPHQ